jgi:rhomboid protease GluP
MQQLPENQNGQPEPGVRRLRVPTSRPILTYGILAVIVGIAFLQILLRQLNWPAPEPITGWGALNYERILQGGEYYRLFTSMFLHANEAHLLFNALALWSFGRSVEAFFGTGRFGLIYLLGGLCGSVFSFIFTQGISVGASGALFAIFGAEMVFLYQNRALFGRAAQEQLRSLIILAVLNFGIGIYTQIAASPVQIDNWAHIGGFFAGIVLAWFIGPQYRLVQDNETQDGVRIVDSIPPAKMLTTPALFAAGLILALAYAVVSFR